MRNCPTYKQVDLSTSKSEISRSYEDCSYANTDDEEKESGSEFETEQDVLNKNGSINNKICIG